MLRSRRLDIAVNSAGTWLFLLSLVAFSNPARATHSATQSAEAVTPAITAIQVGNFVAARDLLLPAVQQSPNSPELWNLLGISQSELHEEKAAYEAFENGLRIAPDSISLNENIGFLFFREEDYRTAKQYLKRAVRLGSQQPGVHFSLAASERRTGEQAQALQELKSLEPALGTVSNYWVERGAAELPQDTASADASFARALALDPQNLAALNGAASTAEQEGLDEKALAYLIQARKRHPNDVPTLLHFGTVCLRRDLGIDALEAAKQAYHLQPTNDYAVYLLGRANVSQQNWQAAYNLFDLFSQRRPKFAPAYYAMGWLDVKLDRMDEAKKQLEHCLQLDPDLSDARAELAQLYLDNGEADKAHQQFTKVLAQNAHNAKANTGMGDLMLRQGDINSAEQYYQAAIATNPNEGAVHYKLSQVLLRKHDAEAAKKERNLALALNAEAKQASKTPLRLAMPDSSTLP